MAALTGDVVANYLKNVRANGLGPRTIIVSIAKSNMTNAELNTYINYITNAQGTPSYGTPDSNGPDAFVVAGLSSDGGDAGGTTKFVSGESDVVYLALQGTGTFGETAVEALTGTPTVTVLATFDQNY